MIVKIHPHAKQRMRERGASAAQVKETVLRRRMSAAEFGRTQFRCIFAFNSIWNGKHFARKQIDAFAAKIPSGWMVVKIIVKYF